MIIDSVTHEESTRESIASHIRYETDKTEQQKLLLPTEVALRNSIIRIYTIAGIAFVFFIFLPPTWFWSRHRTLRLHHRVDEKELELASVRLEQEFRTAFSGIYPLPLPRLREACPGITKNEELLCMLILTKQTTEDIARILGIAPASVSRIRYWLRPKLNLPEKASLDAEIKRIMR